MMPYADVLRRVQTQRANPVLIKELRGRFRGPRTFAVLTGFLLLLAALAFVTYASQAWQPPFTNQYSYSSPYYANSYASLDRSAEIGKSIFTAVAVLEMLLVALIGPALSFGSISGEIEKQTYELLLATPLSGGAIVRGKMGAAMAFVALLVAASLPVMSLAFLYGGVGVQWVLLSQASIALMGLEFVALGTFFSALLRRTSRAAVVTYAAIFFWSLLPLFALWVAAVLFMGMGTTQDSDIERLASVALLAVPFAHPYAASVSSLFEYDSANAFWLAAFAFHSLVTGFLLVATPTLVRRRQGSRRVIGLVFAAAFFLWFLVVWSTVDTIL